MVEEEINTHPGCLTLLVRLQVLELDCLPLHPEAQESRQRWGWKSLKGEGEEEQSDRDTGPQEQQDAVASSGMYLSVSFCARDLMGGGWGGRGGSPRGKKAGVRSYTSHSA